MKQRRMNSTHLGLLVAIWLTLIFTHANATADINGEKAYAKDYFPLDTGNSWTYENTTTSTSVTRTVLSGTTKVKGIATKSVRDSLGETSHYTNDANGLRLHKEVDHEGSVTYSPPIKYSHSELSIGDSIPSRGKATLVMYGYGTFNLNYTATSRILAT